ncbi:hypothetical protein QBC34DRAFT_411591 [Podospora aff. communis PSN243]|uniref:CDP-diacylglycerol--glycerol-3-phosphate 3-phosphatidyltransferase n=1 Tax=Podospora aff. communis PSN243 TaxID=3040156 RepID=A0AAV9GDZ1_9PEZI|nr:hypothetical protein QBC34DRAFT_411591 [Podospora aff. communis PSN243]
MEASRFLRLIDDSLPRFEVASSKIDILNHPSEFLDALLAGVASARSRIFLCSLYIGTDVPVLVSALRTALRTQPNLTLCVLLDRLRCTRPGPESDGTTRTTARMLLPLLREFGPERVVLRFYHTPSFRGLWKWLVPSRLNEGFGLQHIKLCGFDDQVIVTGANLSSEYFTNRQDRYYRFSDSPSLVQYLDALATTLGGFSYSMIQTFDAQEPTFDWPNTNYTLLPLEQSDETTIREAAHRHLMPVIWNCKTREKGTRGKTTADTVVYPLAQFTPLLGRLGTHDSHRSTHEWAVTHLLGFILAHCATWTLSTPYLALTPGLRRWLTGNQIRPTSRPQTGTVIAAAPEAMSFYGAKGLARYIPRAFSEEFRKLQRLIDLNAPSTTPSLLQWRRGIAHAKNGWTFHAKGWWIGGVCDEKDDLSMTSIGSSNYGERSLNLDLELDLLIVTRDPELKRRIHGEERKILKYGQSVGRAGQGKRGKSPGHMLEGVVVWVLMLVIGLMGLSI